MFTRLLVGLDGSPRADSAFEQAVFLGKRFGSAIIVAYVHEPDGQEADGPAMLDRARDRVLAAGLQVEATALTGDADVELAELAKAADAVLVGRRGVTTKRDALGPTVTSLIRIAERCVIVCGGLPSPMQSLAVAFDGGDTSHRALERATQFASIVGSTDRKSTRLNSSHLVISYAVFCLKKKKKKNDQTLQLERHHLEHQA